MIRCRCGVELEVGCMLTRGGPAVDIAKATASIGRGLGWTETANGWRCANCTVAARGRREALS